MLSTDCAGDYPAKRRSESDQPKRLKRFRRFCEDHGISYATGYRYIKKGLLKARKMGGATVIYREDELAFDAQWPTL